MSLAFPKPPRIKSKALTSSARDNKCTLRGPMCGSEGDGAVFCHVRMVGNAGVATKPPDFFGYYGCPACHRHQEAHSVWFTWGDILRAVCETQTLMAAAGLLQVKGWTPR